MKEACRSMLSLYPRQSYPLEVLCSHHLNTGNRSSPLSQNLKATVGLRCSQDAAFLSAGLVICVIIYIYICVVLGRLAAVSGLMSRRHVSVLTCCFHLQTSRRRKLPAVSLSSWKCPPTMAWPAWVWAPGRCRKANIRRPSGAWHKVSSHRAPQDVLFTSYLLFTHS